MAYKVRYDARPSDNPLVLMMRSANDQEVVDLNAKLVEATAGDLEVTLSGAPYEGHRVPLPFITRVLESLQSTFRASCRAIAPQGKLRRPEATLSLAATAPGSFKVLIMMPPAQLDLLEPPIVDHAMATIIDLLGTAERGTAAEDAHRWAAESDEPAVRSMIRFAVALAGSRGAVTIRWRPTNASERFVTVTSDAAKTLVLALSGEAGREILTITGHLEMAQDQPPRVRIRTSRDDYLARIPTEELLDRARDLLFTEVQATIIVAMRTSSTTGSPDTDIELLDLQQS